ncbi:J domain-containing protein [Anoxynatronum buryatiense]|uniref:Curved DNA-binding protein n=1 Tax=Anoxynatronum buryatiense TaxID=489973 RepID=A0AA46AH96_9CLOT|nr:J domain-containing protein [Anoxynatronum buryatiense]SMP37906.1 curved DNA-binding protein [Anoxynatronum buryatiense]
MQYKDYYKTLQVQETADQNTIKQAYRSLAKKYHPDGHHGDQLMANKFKEINEAYEVLGNSEKRQKYDYIRNQSSGTHGTAFDPSQFGYQFSKKRKKQNDGNDSGFSDFFDAFFGSEMNGGYRFDSFYSSAPFQSYRTADGNNTKQFAGAATDTTAVLQLTLAEAFHGVKKNIILRNGADEKTLQVKVPAGVLSGEKLKLEGEGGHAEESLQQGDLYLQIEIKENDAEKLDGLNIIQKLPVTVWEAALGGSIKINTLSGPLRFTLPPSTSSGKTFRVKGKGFKNRKGETGDLLLAVEIKLPTTFSLKEKDHFAALKDLSTFNPRS